MAKATDVRPPSPITMTVVTPSSDRAEVALQVRRGPPVLRVLKGNPDPPAASEPPDRKGLRVLTGRTERQVRRVRRETRELLDRLEQMERDFRRGSS